MKKISLPFVLFLDVYVRRGGGYSSRNNSHVGVIARCNSMCEGGCHGNAGHLSPHSPHHSPPPNPRSSHNADNLNPSRRNALSNNNVSFVIYVQTDSIGWGVNTKFTKGIYSSRNWQLSTQNGQYLCFQSNYHKVSVKKRLFKHGYPSDMEICQNKQKTDFM